MLVYVGIALLGWMLGVLINYLADVLPRKRQLSAPFCSNCETTQSLFNYIVWPRRCPKCDYHRPIRTWLVELVYIGLAVWLWYSPPENLGFLIGLVLLVFFGLVIIIDLEHRLILHRVSFAGALLGFVIGIRLHGLWVTLLGGIAGFGFMLILYFLGEWLIRLIAHWRGQTVDDVALGFGDVNLGGVLGLVIGWPGIVLGLFIAILSAGVVSLIYLLIMVGIRRYKMFMALPYGPFLITGAVVLLYFQNLLKTWLK